MSQNDSIRQANAATFERLLDWFPDIIQSVDRDGKIVYANRKASEVFGYTTAELLGMNITQLYAPELLEQVRTGFTRLQRQGNLTVYESVVLDKSGARIPVEIRSFAVYDGDNRFQRTFSILRDLRSIKALQDNLLHASRLAAVGELAASIVHDIASPLGVITLSGELLRAELQHFPLKTTDANADAVRQSLEIVSKAAEKIERLVNHLRNLARANDVKPERLDLRQCIDGALFMVKSKLDKGRVRVAREMPETPCPVVGYDVQLEQVFMNLCSNACDAMQGVAEPTLTVRLRHLPDTGEGAQWECRVRDVGCGIPPEDRERVFQAFFTTKRKGEGTGLGLAIVQSIVHTHGGRIELESELNAGSTFRILLPAAGASVGPTSP